MIKAVNQICSICNETLHRDLDGVYECYTCGYVAEERNDEFIDTEDENEAEA